MSTAVDVVRFQLGTDELEYWTCTIGPVRRSEIPKGADSPMRAAVERAFKEITGRYPERLSSGWGCSVSMAHAVEHVTCAGGDNFTVLIKPG